MGARYRQRTAMYFWAQIARGGGPRRAWVAVYRARAAVVEFLAMRQFQAILVIVALLATPLALLARAVEPGMPDCNGMCCLPHGGHHHMPARNSSPEPQKDDMAFHTGGTGAANGWSLRVGGGRRGF